MRPSRVHVKLFLGAALLVAPLVIPATAVAVPSAAVSAEECAEVTSARVPKWAQGLKEPAQVGPEKVAQIQRRLEPGLARAQGEAAASRLFPGLVTVPTWVHVISANRRVSGGNVPDQCITHQMNVLNASFSGATGGAPTVFQFQLAAVTRTVNRAWASLEPETAEELEAKTALRRGGPETLNIYLVPDAGGLLGWAYLPDGEVEHTPWDGVVVLAGSLPGGDAAPYNEGDT